MNEMCGWKGNDSPWRRLRVRRQLGLRGKAKDSLWARLFDCQIAGYNFSRKFWYRLRALKSDCASVRAHLSISVRCRRPTTAVDVLPASHWTISPEKARAPLMPPDYLIAGEETHCRVGASYAPAKDRSARCNADTWYRSPTDAYERGLIICWTSCLSRGKWQSSSLPLGLWGARVTHLIYYLPGRSGWRRRNFYWVRERVTQKQLSNTSHGRLRQLPALHCTNTHI